MNSARVAGYCDPKFSQVEEIFSHSIKSGHELGASLAVEIEGEKVIDLWGGFCDEARSKSWERDTIVNVFSVSKAITSVCLGRLMERGLIDVNAQVRDYWPEFGSIG